MSPSFAPSLELRGEFRGFFRDLFGKRRMVLRVGGEERYLKVPKELREQLNGKIAAGDEIVAVGVEELDGIRRRFVVSTVRSTSGDEICATCPIRICTKKNCWRNGGRELWTTLEDRLAKAGLAQWVALKPVHCLDHCKHAPNAEWQGRDYRDCDPARAAELADLVIAQTTRAKQPSQPKTGMINYLHHHRNDP